MAIQKQQPLFTRDREGDFFKRIANEVINIGGQFIIYFDIDVQRNRHDVYGENVGGKVILKDGMKLPCRYEMEDTMGDTHGQIIERTKITMWFSREYLDSKKIQLKNGRYFYVSNDLWFEMTEVINKPYAPQGQPWLNNTIYVEGISISTQQLEIETDLEYTLYD